MDQMNFCYIAVFQYVSIIYQWEALANLFATRRIDVILLVESIQNDQNKSIETRRVA